MTCRGTPVKNQVLIRELDYCSRLMDIKWVIVYLHYHHGTINLFLFVLELCPSGGPGRGHSRSQSTVSFMSIMALRRNQKKILAEENQK